MDELMERMLDDRDEINRQFEAYNPDSVNEAPEDLPDEEEDFEEEEPEDPEEVDAAVADEPGDGRDNEEEVPVNPREEEAPHVEKEYLGHTKDTHYYMVGVQEDGTGATEDLIVVDQEGIKVYSAEEKGLPINDIVGFIREVYKDLQIEDIANTIYMKYIYPAQVEAEVESEEEVGVEPEEEEDPGKEELPSEEELEAEYPTESVLRENVQLKYGGKTFDVALVDEGGDGKDTVVVINGSEFKQSGEFSDLFKNDEGILDDSGLEELALDLLSTMSEEDFVSLTTPKMAKESFLVRFKDGKNLKVQGFSRADALKKALSEHKGKPIKVYTFEDKVPGGLADGEPDCKYSEEQLNRGIEVEKEHTDDPKIAKEIAKDHLEEDPEYYGMRDGKPFVKGE